MPKKKNAKPATEQVAWINELPEKGGAWGRSIIQTVDAMEGDLSPMRDEFEVLSEKIVAREAIVKDAVKRADREAKGLFNDRQIAAAKKKVEDAAAKAEADAAKADAAEKAEDKPANPKGEGKGGTQARA